MFDERFARQYRYEPPSEFPLTSPYSGIVHHLSGPSSYVRTQTSLRRSKSVVCAKLKNPNSYFHYAYRFATHTLTQLLDSLVRVSRRVGQNHFVSVTECRDRASSMMDTLHLKSRACRHTDYNPLALHTRSSAEIRLQTIAQKSPQLRLELLVNLVEYPADADSPQ